MHGEPKQSAKIALLGVGEQFINSNNISLPSDLSTVRYATFSNRYRLYKNLHWYFGLK